MGWARRPKHGHIYGKSYIDFYRDQIEQYFAAGAKDIEKRMNPKSIREDIRLQNPGVFTIPTESEIKQLVSQLSTQLKQNTGKGQTKRARIPLQYVSDLEQLLDLSTKNSVVYLEMVKKYSDGNGNVSVDLPSKSTLLSKYSALKRKRKKEAEVFDM